MFTAADYRKFADECIKAARDATADAGRKHHLDMAKMWTKAAVSLDGGSMIPKFPDQEARD